MKPFGEELPYYDINCFTIREMTECARRLRTIAEGASSMEEAAGRIVRHLYYGLVDGEPGKRATVLVRLFKTHPYHMLEPELQEVARGMLGDKPFPPEMKCMVLLATAGAEPQWNSRISSKGHRAIPLPSEDAMREIPMFLPLIEQFGMNIDMVIKPDLKFLLDMEQRAFNVYHVPEALGNPYITAQKEFVIPYGVKSILGFGGMLPSGDMFAVPLFFKVPVPRKTAELFSPLSLSVKLAILPYENSVFKPGDTIDIDSHLVSKTLSLEHLMEVYEETVVEQSDKLYAEIGERKAAERELSRYRAHLEELVKSRTGELVKANELLKNYSEDLERSNRELEQFAYIASHDLKSPILALAADLKLFEKRNRDKIDEESLQYIKDALTSALRLENLIKDLLSYARVGANFIDQTAERISLEKIIQIVRDSLKMECENAGCEITSGIMPEIKADFNLRPT